MCNEKSEEECEDECERSDTKANECSYVSVNKILDEQVMPLKSENDNEIRKRKAQEINAALGKTKISKKSKVTQEEKALAVGHEIRARGGMQSELLFGCKGETTDGVCVRGRVGESNRSSKQAASQSVEQNSVNSTTVANRKLVNDVVKTTTVAN